jgi:xanthine dehydrogenase molybdopterin-binding subunit B
MEHIAKVVKKDPIDVRLKNLKDDSNIPNMIEDLKIKADFEERKQSVQEFNKVSCEVYCLLLSFSRLTYIINKRNVDIFSKYCS